MYFDGALCSTDGWSTTDVGHGFKGLPVNAHEPEIHTVRGHQLSDKIKTDIGSGEPYCTAYLIPFYNSAA